MECRVYCKCSFESSYYYPKGNYHHLPNQPPSQGSLKSFGNAGQGHLNRETLRDRRNKPQVKNIMHLGRFLLNIIAKPLLLTEQNQDTAPLQAGLNTENPAAKSTNELPEGPANIHQSGQGPSEQ